MLPRITVTVILIGMVFPIRALGLDAGAVANISGAVSVFSGDPPARLADAKIVFQDADGPAVETVTNPKGEYTASVTPGHDYSVSVTSKGFCPVHRPAFRLSPGSTVRFDFTITLLCPGDRTVSSTDHDKAAEDDAYFNSPIPYYFEESVALGKSHLRTLIIAFGKRTKKGDAQVEYFPLPSREHSNVRLPVTMAFDTYTVKADRAVLDRRTRVLSAKGNVSVADGTDSPPRTAACLMVPLDDAEPRVHPCLPDSNSKQNTNQFLSAISRCMVHIGRFFRFVFWHSHYH